MLVMSMILFFLGAGMIVLGVEMGAPRRNPLNFFKKLKSRFHFNIFFPLFVAFSPLVLVFIKLLGVFKKESKLIISQSKMASRGEAVLEAAPFSRYTLFSLPHHHHPGASGSPSFPQYLRFLYQLWNINTISQCCNE